MNKVSNFMKKTRRYLLIILTVAFFFPVFSSVYAGNLDDAFKLGGTLDSAAGAQGAGYSIIYNKPESVISLAISAFLSFLGVIFIALMLYGGYLWMTDRGNEDQVKKAKDLIASAIIGLLVIISAYAISYFVISYFSKGAIE